MGIIGQAFTHVYPSRPCVCRFLLINFKTLRIFFRAGARGCEGVKIGDGRRAGCHRRGLLNRLVRGRTEPPICTCTRVINGLRTDFKSWNNSLLQEKLSGAYRTLAGVSASLIAIKRLSVSVGVVVALIVPRVSRRRATRRWRADVRAACLRRPRRAVVRSRVRSDTLHYTTHARRSTRFFLRPSGRAVGRWGDELWKILEKRRNCSRYIIKVRRTATTYSDVLCRRALGCRGDSIRAHNGWEKLIEHAYFYADDEQRELLFFFVAARLVIDHTMFIYG